MEWIRGFGYKYRHDTIAGAPHCYAQMRVVFRRGRMPGRVETHTGCRACACAVLGLQAEWARRHEAEVHAAPEVSE